MSSQPLYIAYYQSAYGPAIRIDAQENDHLFLLREILLRLANKYEEEVKMDVGNFPDIQFLRLGSLVLKVGQDPYSPSHVPGTLGPMTLIKKFFSIKTGSVKTLTNGPNVDEAPCFIWKQNPVNWRSCVEIVDKLLKEIVPCHYYLTQECVDDALIELGYLEPRAGRFDGASN